MEALIILFICFLLFQLITPLVILAKIGNLGERLEKFERPVPTPATPVYEVLRNAPERKTTEGDSARRPPDSIIFESDEIFGCDLKTVEAAPKQPGGDDAQPVPENHVEYPSSARPEKSPRNDDRLKNETAGPEAAQAAALSEAIPPAEKSAFEQKAEELFRRAWNWICVGEEFRPANIAPEYAVATTWLVRISVLLLLTGAAYFIKYSHDNNLFHPAVRLGFAAAVAIAMLVAGGVWSHGKYRMIALGLTGAGLVILYFIGYASANIYNLLPNAAAFALMIAVTVTGGFMADRRNAMLIAVIALAGGYSTPAAVNADQRDFWIYFPYLLLLGAGALLIARRRNWPLLNILAFGASMLLYLPISTGSMTRGEYPAVLLFGICFFLLFSLLPITHNLINRVKITLIELLLLLANVLCFVGSAVPLVCRFSDNSKPASLITFGMALFYLVQLGCFIRRRQEDRNLFLTWLTLMNFSLFISFPLLFSGSWITAAWAAQAVAMLYLGLGVGSRFLECLSYFLYGVTAVRVMCSRLYILHPAPTYLEGLTDRLLSLGVLTLAAAAGYLLLRRAATRLRFASAGESNDIALPPRPGVLCELFLWAAVLLFASTVYLEAVPLAQTGYPPLKLLIQTGALSGLLIFLAAYSTRKYRPGLIIDAAVLLIIVIGGHLVFSDGKFWLLGHIHHFNCADFTLRLSEILIAVLAIMACAKFFSRNCPSDFRSRIVFFKFSAGILWFVYSTLELNFLLKEFLPQFSAGGVSALWGIYSLLLMAAGILKDRKTMRYCGLAMLTVTALKVFLLDLKDLSTPYRIITLIAVGAIAMGGAWLYMRSGERFRRRDGREA